MHSGMLGLPRRRAGVRDVTGKAQPYAARRDGEALDRWVPPGGGDGRRGRPIEAWGKGSETVNGRPRVLARRRPSGHIEQKVTLVIAGIDTHKDTLAVAVVDDAGRLIAGGDIPNTELGFVQLVDMFDTHQVLRVPGVLPGRAWPEAGQCAGVGGADCERLAAAHSEAVASMVGTALAPPAEVTTILDSHWVAQTADHILTVIEASRSTWQMWHVRAEAQRQVRTTGVTAEQVALAAPHDGIEEPEVLRRLDGTSVYTVAGARPYTSQRDPRRRGPSRHHRRTTRRV